MWFEHSEIPMLYLQDTTEKGFKSSSGVDYAPCDNQNSLFGFKRGAIVQPSSARAHGDGEGFRADENGKRHGSVQKDGSLTLFFFLVAHSVLNLKLHFLERERFCRRVIQCLSLLQQGSHQIVGHVSLSETNSKVQKVEGASKLPCRDCSDRSTSTLSASASSYSSVTSSGSTFYTYFECWLGCPQEPMPENHNNHRLAVLGTNIPSPTRHLFVSYCETGMVFFGCEQAPLMGVVSHGFPQRW
jgi:hypothetical protein